MENITLNKQMGLKWFNFFVKVRPVLHFISCFFILIAVSMDPQLYLGNPFMLLYVLGTVVQCTLVEISSIKAKEENYGRFVAFVKKALVYEIIFASYSGFVESYFVYNAGIIYSLVTAANNLILLYFLWYRLNVKYFEKRMLVVTPVKTRIKPANVETEVLDAEDYSDDDDDDFDDYDDDDDDDYAPSSSSGRRCYVCGLELDDDDVFCERCGTRIKE